MHIFIYLLLQRFCINFAFDIVAKSKNLFTLYERFQVALIPHRMIKLPVFELVIAELITLLTIVMHDTEIVRTSQEFELCFMLFNIVISLIL